MKFTGERFIPNGIESDEISIEHFQRYYSVLNLVEDKIVLDAASGEGYGSFLLASKAKKVYGLDKSREAIVHAGNRYKRENLEYLEGSIGQLPFADNSIDIIVSFETIEHVDDDIQKKFMNEVTRVLKKDGILVISTPDKYIYSEKANYKNEFHIKEFYEHEFQFFLNSYFKNVNFFYQKARIVSVLSNIKTNNLSVLNVDDQQQKINGKYIIALCSNQEINKIDISTAVIDFNDKLEKNVDRILSLQAEIDEKNTHITNLLNEIAEKNSLILNQNKTIEELSSWGKSLDKEIVIKNKIINEQTERINDLIEWGQKQKDIVNDQKNAIEYQRKTIEELLAKKENLQEELKGMNEFNMNCSKMAKELKLIKDELNAKIEEINNLKAHIDQLLEKERHLNNILSSDGWKILAKYYKLRDMIFPPQSKRTLLAKLIFRLIKKPNKIIKNLSKENIKKFWYYLKTEDIKRVCNRIENYIEKYNASDSKEIKIIKPSKEIKEKIIFKKQENPLVSIVIPVFNQWEYTYSCLKSIYENTTDVEYEIIIADDVSTDKTINIRDYVENITVIRNEVNKGFLLNCNNAARYAKGKYIHFLNNDTNVQQGWLSSLVDLAEKDEKIGLVGSKLIYQDGRLQEAGGIIWKDGSGWNYGRLDDPEKPEYNYVKEVDYISGASIMVRKELWDKIGGFDERYAPAYYEDTDLAFEINKLGFKVVYQPQSVVVHFEGISHGTDIAAGVKKYQVENREKFVLKWQKKLQEAHFENGQEVFKARDKSSNKKVVLVIDHYVPHYDKDAGSKCTYFYIKLFLKMGYKVIFFGDNFFKHEPYTTHFQQLGVEVLYGNWYAKNIWKWIQQNGHNLDYVYLNRPHISIKYIDGLKEKTKAKIIYFGHDLHYLREMRNYEIEKKEALLKSSDDWKKIEFELISKSDVVYVVSTFEKEILDKEFPEKIIRTIPVYIYDEIKTGVYKSYNERKDLLFVGGFGHKPNIDAVLWFVKEIFPLVVRQIPNIKLYVVGSNPPEEIKKLASNNVVVTGFVSDKELGELYNQCRIVVVPLRFGAGVKGKVVEALYHQVPIVTTSIGAEGLPGIKDYLLIDDDPVSFAEKVVNLYTDINKWNELSHTSLHYISENFSTEAAFNIVANDFK